MGDFTQGDIEPKVVADSYRPVAVFVIVGNALSDLAVSVNLNDLFV